MARLKSVKSTFSSAWDEYGGWIILIFFAYMLYTFRKVFSSVGDTVGDAVQGATANAQAKAQTKAEKAKVQQAAGVKTDFTEAQLATFRADAQALAGYLKTLSTLPFLEKQLSFANDTAAFSLIKQRYSRLKLVNNKPCILVKKNANGTIEVRNVTVETAACIKMAFNYKVLIPYYKEATDNRDLVSDFRAAVTSAAHKPFLPWIL